MNEDAKKILPFVINSLNKELYPSVLQWVKKNSIFRASGMNSSNSKWQKKKNENERFYIDWAICRNKFHEKKTMRRMKQNVRRAIKCPSNADKVEELVSPEEHWFYYKLLKTPEEILAPEVKNATKEKKRENKKGKIQSVKPIFQESSSSSSDSSNHINGETRARTPIFHENSLSSRDSSNHISGEIPASKKLPPFSAIKPNISPSKTLELRKMSINLNDQSEIKPNNIPTENTILSEEILLFVESSIYLNNAAVDLMISNSSKSISDLPFESGQNQVSNQVQTFCSSQSSPEITPEVDYEQSLQQMPSMQCDTPEVDIEQSLQQMPSMQWENICSNDSVDCVNLIGFEEELNPDLLCQIDTAKYLINIVMDTF